MPGKASITFLLCALAVIQGVGAASWRNNKVDHHGNATENFSSSGLKLYVSSPKLRFAKNEDIAFNVALVNEGAYPVTVYLHENPLKNFTIIARDREGRRGGDARRVHVPRVVRVPSRVAVRGRAGSVRDRRRRG